jgi:hypothetical protein
MVYGLEVFIYFGREGYLFFYFRGEIDSVGDLSLPRDFCTITLGILTGDGSLPLLYLRGELSLRPNGGFDGEVSRFFCLVGSRVSYCFIGEPSRY